MDRFDRYRKACIVTSLYNLRKTIGSRVSPILVTLMSRSDSNFERSNTSLKENKQDAVDPNSNGLEYCVRKNEGIILWFSADCLEWYSKFHVGRHFFLAWAWRVSMWAWRVDDDGHLFDWMIFTSNVRKIRGSLSGDNVPLALSQWKTRWYPQSREGDVSTRHVHYPGKVPTIKKFAV